MKEKQYLEQLQAGLRVTIADRLLRSPEFEMERDATLRATVYSISTWYASNKILEDTQTFTKTLSWRERIKALLGGEVPYKLTVTLRRNCPHVGNDPDKVHYEFLENGV